MPRNAKDAGGSLWDSQWSTAQLLGGLCIPLVVWMLAGFGSRLSPEAVQIAFPVLTTAMLVYPLVTRRNPGGYILQVPGLKQFGREAAVALILVSVCLVLNLIVMMGSRWLWPDVSYAPERLHRAAQSNLTPWFVAIAVYSTFFTPLAEEVFFRSFLLRALHRRLPLFAAILIQAAVFGLMHAYSFGATVSTVLVGIVLGTVYCWRRTVLSPYLVHAAYNAVGFAVIIAGMLTSSSQATLGVIPDMDSERCIVKTIIPDSPADRAGMNAGDIILKINDRPIGTSKDLLSCVSGFKPGAIIEVQFTRGDSTLIRQVQLSRRDQTDKSDMR